MKKILDGLTKFIIYVSFAVPIIVAPASFIFPFIVPKILIFRSLVALMLCSYVLLLIINYKEYKPKFTILNLVMSAFFISFALSTLFGVDAYHSFWDNHERMLGLFTIAHYWAYYFICSSIFKNWRQWRLASRLFLIVGSVAMLIGLAQVFDPQFMLNQGSLRVISTLGNSIYVGGYGLFLAFLATLLALKEKSPTWRWLTIAMGILALIVMLYSRTRGSVLGLFAGVLAVFIGYLLLMKSQKKIRTILGVALLASVALVGILYANRQTQFVSSLPAIGRTLNTPFSNLTGSPRWIAWEIAVETWKKKPIFGWGPNNFFYAFNQHYNPRSLNFGYGETWFDNAHNIILNTLAVQGGIGLVIYLSIFAFGVFSLVRNYRWEQATGGKADIHLTVIGSGFLVAHLVQNFTVFENPTSYLYFMFWLAMINQQTGIGLVENKQKEDKDNREKETGAVADKKVGPLAIAGVSIFGLAFILLFNFQPARANVKTLATLRALSSEPAIAAPLIEEALNFKSPHIDDIRSDIGRLTNQIMPSALKRLTPEQSLAIMEPIYQGLRQNLSLHPLDIRTHLTLAQTTQIIGAIKKDARYIFESEQYLTEALNVSPRRQQVMFGLAEVKFRLGRNDQAIELLKQALEYNTDIAESHWRLALAYKTIGQVDKALEVIDQARQNGINFSKQDEAIIKKELTPTNTATTTPAVK